MFRAESNGNLTIHSVTVEMRNWLKSRKIIPVMKFMHVKLKKIYFGNVHNDRVLYVVYVPTWIVSFRFTERLFSKFTGNLAGFSVNLKICLHSIFTIQKPYNIFRWSKSLLTPNVPVNIKTFTKRSYSKRYQVWCNLSYSRKISHRIEVFKF